METLIKMEGMPEKVLIALLHKGYFKTKTEAMRAGILALGEKHKVLEEIREQELETVAQKLLKEEKNMRKKGLKFITNDEVKKKYGFK